MRKVGNVLEKLIVESLKLSQLVLILGKLMKWFDVSWLVVFSPVLVVLSIGAIAGIAGIFVGAYEGLEKVKLIRRNNENN